MLEISPASDGAVETSLAAIRTVAPDAARVGNQIVVRARHVFELIPRLMDALAATGGGAADMNLRSNSLEDVFISLTGRRLRE